MGFARAAVSSLVFLILAASLASPVRAAPDVIFYEDDLYHNYIASVNIDDPPLIRHDPVTWRILNDQAAVVVTNTEPVHDDHTGRAYPNLLYLYSEEDQANIGDALSQYEDHVLELRVVRRGALPRQPELFIPVDFSDMHPFVQDPNETPVKPYVPGHRMLVLRKAFFWENSEQTGGCHGPWADLKIDVFDPAIMRYGNYELFNASGVWSDSPPLGLRLRGQTLPGPAWSGYQSFAGFDPFNEWVDGPWGCYYSNIAVWDWDAPDRDFAGPIAVGVNEADRLAPLPGECRGSPPDFLGPDYRYDSRGHPGKAAGLIDRTMEGEIWINLKMYGWVVLQNITVCDPLYGFVSPCIPPYEVPVGGADVYWFRGWSGSHAQEIYGPPTIACPDYGAPNQYELCQLRPGSQYIPLTDSGLRAFLVDPNTVENVKVGILGPSQPTPVIAARNVIAFEVSPAEQVAQQGEQVGAWNLSLYNHSRMASAASLTMHVFLSRDPVSPEPRRTADDVDIGAIELNVSPLTAKEFRPLVVSGVPGISVPCDLATGDYYLGTRINDSPPSSPATPVKMHVTSDVAPPVISCPANVVVECNSSRGVSRDAAELSAFFATVTAQDACGSTITNDAPPEFHVGSTTVTFTATDSHGNSTRCSATVKVVDTTQPTIAVKLEPLLLPKPDHEYRTIAVADLVASVSDVCDGSVGLSSLRVVSVASDEAEDAPGGGDGATMDDAVVVCPNSVRVRAERQGPGNGRVYTITYTASDLSGNRTTVDCHVYVPHDQSGDLAIEGPGPGYTVNAACGIVGFQGERAASGPGAQGMTVASNQRRGISIRFANEKPARARLDVYDVAGNLVRTLDGSYGPGPNIISWDGVSNNGRRVANGVYVFRLSVEGSVHTAKSVLMRSE